MDLENKISDYLKRALESLKAKKRLNVALTPDLDLVESGIVDSMEFLRLVSDVEAAFNLEIDFNDPEPGAFTTFGGLVRHCVKFGKAA